MQITMWRTTKRDNSTATPSSKPAMFTNAVTLDVALKETTDVLAPTFLLNITGHDGQNYVQAFGRYYWVTGVKCLNNDYWEIDCKVDPLGSYRGHIRNTQAFVLYDSTANTELPDPRLAVKTTPTTAQETANMPWGFDSGDGTTFIAIDGDGDLVDQGKADGATGVYITDQASISNIGMEFTIQEIMDAMTQWLSYDVVGANFFDQYLGFRTLDDLLDLMGNLLANPSVQNGIMMIPYGLILMVLFPTIAVLALLDAIKGLIIGGDALKHVKSAYWLPFDEFAQTVGVQKNKVAFGSYVDQIGVSKLVSNPLKSNVAVVSIPWQYSDWRNVQCTEIQLYIPLIGIINIPASAVKGQNVLTLKTAINLYSGLFSVRVQCGDVTLGTYGVDCKQPILIGDSNVNAGAVTNTVVATAGTIAAGVATGGAGAAVAAGALAAANSGLNCIQPISTCVGGIGGGAGNSLGKQIVCVTICHNTSDNPSDLLSIIGTPTNVLKTLTGSGFCQCMQAHMNMSAVTGESYPTAEEVNQVNDYLNTGVFLE